jgi:hypothetical protein
MNVTHPAASVTMTPSPILAGIMCMASLAVASSLQFDRFGGFFIDIHDGFDKRGSGRA